MFFCVGLLAKRKRFFQKQWVLSFLFGLNILVPITQLNQAILGSFIFNAVSLFGLFIGQKMRVIGLTGGIACGKSTVSKMLAKEGFVIIDADKISHDLRAKNKHYQQLLVKEFGP